MKIIAIYFSLNGNSEYVAQEIHKELGADLLKLETAKPYPKNPASLFFVGGGSALKGEKPELKPYQFQEADYDLVILISPNWANSYVPAFNTFLSEHALKDKKIGLVVCSKGGKAEKCFEKMYETFGREQIIETLSLVDPLRLRKDEDLVKIKNFCKAFA